MRSTKFLILASIGLRLVSGQALAISSITDAQASALAAPLAAYASKVEASPSFAQVVAEVARASAEINFSLINSPPSAAEWPALVKELDSIAALDSAVLNGLSTDVKEFLADAARGEIAIIRAVLPNAASVQAPPTETGTVGNTSAGAATKVSGVSSYFFSSMKPTMHVAGNSSAPNASTATAQMPTESTAPKRVSTGAAAAAATAGTGLLTFALGVWVIFA